ncbi:amidohydrolase [Luminiphilus syltensis NOR5-1B]|uniref:Amidohydrolase n=2 Tax=Luminiphilus TaxID=1341118 RepID=B8KY26_9GAMM|nr:amidohydrolase [Luminiphilus syltensis NOR5-1B]
MLVALSGVHQTISATTLLENVHIIPMTGEGEVLKGAVLVNDGHVLAVGPSASITVPAEAKRIDGAGGFLIPGLTDMHNHIDSPESLKLQLAYGVTTIRNMWGTDEVLAQRAAEQAGELLAPDIETVSPIIDHDPPYFPGSITITDAAAADDFVRDLKEQGYTALKTYELIQKEVYFALTKAADRYGMTIEGHIPQAVDAFDAVLLGHDTVEHSMRVDAAIVAPGTTYSSAFRPPELVRLVERIDAGEMTYEEAFRRDMLRALAGLMVENGTALVPTMGVYEVLSYSQSNREAMAKHPLIDYVNPVYKGFWLQADPVEELTNEGVKAEPSDAEIASLEYFASTEHGKWVAIMHEEGVLILAGVDAPNPGMFQGFSLHDELGRMVSRAGMSNYEALKTATVNPTIYWKIEGQRGVIAPGAEADFILLANNPLDEIANTKSIQGVMADGQWLDRTRLDAVLKEVHEAYAAQAKAMEEGGEPAAGFPVHLHGAHE